MSVFPLFLLVCVVVVGGSVLLTLMWADQEVTRPALRLPRGMEEDGGWWFPPLAAQGGDREP